MTKTQTPLVQAIVNQAIADGAHVYALGKHIVAVHPDGYPLYLGGGVEAPTWRPMRELVIETAAAA